MHFGNTLSSGSCSRDRRKDVAFILKHSSVDRHVSFQSLYEGIINSLALEFVENRYLLCGTSSGIIAIYDTSPFVGKQEFKPVVHIGKSNRFCPKHVSAVSWYPFHTGLFASGGEEGILTVWDTNLIKPLDKYRLGCAINNHGFGIFPSSSSLIAVASNQHTIRILDTRIGSSSHVLDAHESSVIGVAWSPSDERILSSGGRNGHVLFWDIRACKLPLISLNYSPPKAGSNSQSAQSWRKARAHGGPVLGLHFLDDNVGMVSLGHDRALKLWDTRTAKFVANLGKMNNNMISSLQFISIASVCANSSPPAVLVPDGKAIRVISLQSGETLARLGGHFDQITSVVVLSDGTYRIVSAGHDQAILLRSCQPV